MPRSAAAGTATQLIPLAQIAPGDLRGPASSLFDPAAQGAALGRFIICFRASDEEGPELPSKALYVDQERIVPFYALQGCEPRDGPPSLQRLRHSTLLRN
jgi:hypothetical protein